MATNPFQYDLRRLAVGVLFMNLGRAAPNFPTTNRAHPSYKVYVDLVPPGSPLNDSYGYLFPMIVPWDIWQNVVVPLFEDGSSLVKVVAAKNGSLRHPNNQIRLTQDLEGLLSTIELELLQSYEAWGYVPPAATTTGYLAGSDPPLTYKTDTELKDEATAVAVAVLAQTVWETEIETEPSFPWATRLDPTLPPTVPPTSSPASQASTVPEVTAVVPAPDPPGGPGTSEGTVRLEYEQFDE